MDHENEGLRDNIFQQAFSMGCGPCPQIAGLGRLPLDAPHMSGYDIYAKASAFFVVVFCDRRHFFELRICFAGFIVGPKSPIRRQTFTSTNLSLS
jgi:hypothetical protein